MKYETPDLREARKLLHMLFDNWVAGDDIEGTSRKYRANLVFYKTVIEQLLEEKEAELQQQLE